MRTPRIKANPSLPAVYHCMSRVAGRLDLLDDSARHKLVSLLHRLARFCDIDIITFCMMSNHFHLLIRVPPKPLPNAIPDSVLLAKLVLINEPGTLKLIIQLPRLPFRPASSSPPTHSPRP